MTLPRIIQCEDHAGRPTPGNVVFGTASGEVTCATDQAGRVRVPSACNRGSFAIIKPAGPFWSASLDFASLPEAEHIRVTMVSLDIQNQAFWWRRMFDHCAHDCAGLRIGIIDLGSREQADLRSYEITDTDGAALDTSTYPSETHGFFVSQVFAGWQDTGATVKARFRFVDVSEPGSEGRKIDALAVVAAVVSLRDDFKADLINMSLGFDEEAFTGGPFEQDVKDFCENMRVEIAAFPGLVIAAAGNTDTQMVKLPAKFEEVVGVTGIAPSSAAFPHTRLELWREHAIYAGELGRSASGDEYFHLKGLSFGDEIDAAAPGAGIWLRGVDGRPVENEGSSFAAPMVTAALACAIARRKQNDRNFRIEKEILEEICVDIGLDKRKQGRGVPLNP